MKKSSLPCMVFVFVLEKVQFRKVQFVWTRWKRCNFSGREQFSSSGVYHYYEPTWSCFSAKQRLFVYHFLIAHKNMRFLVYLDLLEIISEHYSNSAFFSTRFDVICFMLALLMEKVQFWKVQFSFFGWKRCNFSKLHLLKVQ